MDKLDDRMLAQVGDIYYLENRHFRAEDSLVTEKYVERRKKKMGKREGYMYNREQGRKRLHRYWMRGGVDGAKRGG